MQQKNKSFFDLAGSPHADRNREWSAPPGTQITLISRHPGFPILFNQEPVTPTQRTGLPSITSPDREYKDPLKKKKIPTTTVSKSYIHSLIQGPHSENNDYENGIRGENRSR